MITSISSKAKKFMNCQTDKVSYRANIETKERELIDVKRKIENQKSQQSILNRIRENHISPIALWTN